MIERQHSRWSRSLPAALVILRLLLGPAVVCLAYVWPSGPAFAACLTAGFLSDVFDGVLARRLGVATPALRRLDSTADVAFYVAVLWAAAVVYPAVVRAYAPGFAALLALEVACQAVSLVRSGRAAATHAYSAEVLGVTLFVAAVGLLGFGWSWGTMDATIAAGCVAYVEAIAIQLVAPPPAVDVPSLWHAWRRRRTHSVSATRERD